MSDEQNPSGGTAGGDAGSDPGKGKESSGEMVSRSAYEEAMKDVHKFKGELKILKAKANEDETKRLTQANEYKTLWEKSEEARKEESQKYESSLGRLLKTHRFNEVKAEALQLGLKKEALNDLSLLDLDDVKVVATSDDRFLVEGAKDKASRLKNERPHWFGDLKPPTVNSGGGAPPLSDKKDGEKITPDDLNNAERKWKRSQKPEDRKAYEDIYKAYLKQGKVTAVPLQQGR